MTALSPSSPESSAMATICQLLPKRADTEGLTNAVLKDYVQILNARQTQALEALYAHLQQAITSDTGLTTGSSNDASGTGTESVERVVELLQKVEGDAGKAAHAIAELGRDRQALIKRLSEARGAVSALSYLAEGQQQLSAFDAHFAAGEYTEAAAAAEQIGAACAEHPELADAGLLQAHRDRLTALHERVVVAPSQCQLRVGTGGDPGQVWRALGMLGTLDAQMSHVAQVLLEGVAAPLLALPQPLLLTLASGTESGMAVAVMEWRAAAAEEAGDALQPEVGVVEALRFVFEHAFQRDEALALRLGSHLWPALAQDYIAQRLKPLPLDRDKQLPAFEAASRAARQFEEGASSLGFVPFDDEGRSILRKYLQTRMQGFLDAQQLEAVAKARDVLVAPSSELVEVGLDLAVNPEALDAIAAAAGAAAGEGAGSDRPGWSTSSGEGRAGDAEASAPLNWGPEDDEAPLLASGRYKITQAAASLAEVMEEVLVRAVDSNSPEFAAAMCGTAQDVALLLLAVPPVLRPKELQVPQGAALYHNDCRYTAARLLALAGMFPGLAPLAPSSASAFISTALRLRHAAQATLSSLAEKLEGEMREVVAGADRFRRRREGQATVRRVVRQALAALRRLGDTLRHMLPPHDFVWLASRLVQALAERVAGDLLELTDISVGESEELPQVLHPVAYEAANAALGRDPAPEAGGGPLGSHILIQSIEAGAPALLKLRAILELMSARLATFRERWESGNLQGLGFTCPQVAQLIEALFEDTDVRRSTLSAIRGSDKSRLVTRRLGLGL